MKLALGSLVVLRPLVSSSGDSAGSRGFNVSRWERMKQNKWVETREGVVDVKSRGPEGEAGVGAGVGG